VTTMLLWLLALVALAFVISGVTMYFIGRLARRRLPEAMQRATRYGRDPLRVAPMAQYHGLASAGWRQVRGNGSLILTEETLRFDQWSPQRQVIVPLEDVLRVETPRTHAGKWSLRPMLRVTWRTWDGLEDAAAWTLNDLEGWVGQVETAVAAAHARAGETTGED
jgi:hypothetical protein